MTKLHEFQLSLQPKLIGKHAMKGAGLAFVLVLLFTSTLGRGDLGYSAWVFLPMITVSVGGAAGGIFYSLTDSLRSQGAIKKTLMIVANVLIYIASLWLSLIAALNVTGHWN